MHESDAASLKGVLGAPAPVASAPGSPQTQTVTDHVPEPSGLPGPVQIADRHRVRTLTLDRPHALNAFNEALYDAVTDALHHAADDPSTAVVLLTGNGRAFCAGTDLGEMAQRNAGQLHLGRHGFLGMIDALIDFPKPLVMAVNGLAVGVGVTMLAFADLVLMASDARLKCPFTDLGIVPEAGSTYTFPALLGRQRATWVLMSSEWIDAREALEIGLVWKVTEPDTLLAEAYRYAAVLASKPISSLTSTKALIGSHSRDLLDSARAGESAVFAALMGGPANVEALAAFAEGRKPNFTQLPPGW